MPKASVGKRNHQNLTTSARLELAEMTDLFDRLINEVDRLQRSPGLKNTSEISRLISKLALHHNKAVRHVNAIWELITIAGDAEKSAIEAQLYAISERIDEHDKLIQWLQQILSNQEQAEQLFGEGTK